MMGEKRSLKKAASSSPHRMNLNVINKNERAEHSLLSSFLKVFVCLISEHALLLMPHIELDQILFQI